MFDDDFKQIPAHLLNTAKQTYAEVYWIVHKNICILLKQNII